MLKLGVKPLIVTMSIFHKKKSLSCLFSVFSGPRKELRSRFTNLLLQLCTGVWIPVAHLPLERWNLAAKMLPTFSTEASHTDFPAHAIWCRQLRDQRPPPTWAGAGDPVKVEGLRYQHPCSFWRIWENLVDKKGRVSLANSHILLEGKLTEKHDWRKLWSSRKDGEREERLHHCNMQFRESFQIVFLTFP